MPVNASRLAPAPLARSTSVPVSSRKPPVPAHDALALLREGEDAGLTGMTRSLNRRLLGLNVAGSLLLTCEQNQQKSFEAIARSA